MNKFIVLATVALACLVAVSAGPIDQETSGLQGKNSEFSDFCNSFRDYVENDMKSIKDGGKFAELIAIKEYSSPRDIVALMESTGAIKDICGHTVKKYLDEIKGRFLKARDEVAARDPSLANVQPEELGCATVGRVIYIDNACSFVQAMPGK